jgi:hypothetical protein
VLHAHLSQLPAYLLLLLSIFQDDLWQFISEADAFLPQIGTPLQFTQTLVIAQHAPLFIASPLRLMVHTKPDIFYFNSPLAIAKVLRQLAGYPRLGFDTLAAIKKHRSLQIVFDK